MARGDVESAAIFRQFFANALPMISLSALEDPDHWLKRAKEARVLADAMTDVQSKAVMHKIAENYEKLALRAKQRGVERG